MTQTWNTSGTPTFFPITITDTNSHASSLIADWKIGATSMFKVDKTGGLQTGAPTGGSGAGVWKAGTKITGTFILDTGNCIELDVNGVLYKVALVN
jgi:hypothetical protein